MPIKKTIENILFSQIVLRYSLAEIEKSLSVRMVGIERVTKAYGSKANSFLIKTISAKNKNVIYFLKFNRRENIKKEIESNQFIKRFLPVPEVILISQAFRWILFEYIPGELMAEGFLKIKSKKDLRLFCKIERQKEKLLSVLYSKSKSRIGYTGYMGLRANRLFCDRLFGERYKSFFAKSPDNISSYFDHQFIINNREFPYTVNQILESIRKKYSLHDNRKVTAAMGHGDAHHGNIIVDKKIWFIDNEYAGLMPPFMELAKPYYNDFIGTLFFHHYRTLNQYFQIKHFKDTGTKLIFTIKCPQKIDNFLKVTKLKLQERKKFVNKKTEDFLSLNDYLVLCHTLTKNPNKYSLKTKLLFLIFTVILAKFDPFNPDSIYDFFKNVMA